MTQSDLYLLAPEISMVGLAVMVIIVDLTTTRKELLAWLSFLGLAVPASLTLLLWGELSGWWNLVGTADAQKSISGLFGTLAIGSFALFFKFLFIGALALVVLASGEYTQRFRQNIGEYYTLIILSTAGMMLLVSSTELISIYIALELSTLPLVALVALQGDSRSAEAGLKFLVLAALSSAILLYGMALTFGFSGSTHLEGIAAAITSGDQPFGGPVLLVGIIMMIAGFGFKIAAVPFQMWVPDVYEGAPTPVTAYLSVASKAAGFAVLLQVFYTAFGALEGDWGLLFAVISAASMTIGNLVAIAQSNIKRMMAYSTIAHAGYMLVALAAVASRSVDGVALGPSTLLFYLAGYTFTNLTAFFAIIAITNRIGSDLINDLVGMGKRAPFLALILTIGLISLTGIPPTVGFIAKIFVFSAAIKANLAWLVLVGVLNSVLSAYYYLRIVRMMYLGQGSSDEPIHAEPSLKWAMGIAGVGVIVLGIWPQAVLSIAEQAQQMLIMAP
jgi:NADH-quinone oxidoreductase subunit N